MNKRVSVLGCGHAGAGSILYLLEKSIARVLFYAEERDIAQGKALDLLEAAAPCGWQNRVSVVPLGEALRAPVIFVSEESYLPLIQDRLGKNSVVICLFPGDGFTKLIRKGHDRKKVFGIGGTLGLMSVLHKVSESLNLCLEDLQGFVLGGSDGKFIVPQDAVRAGGIPVRHIDKEAAEEGIKEALGLLAEARNRNENWDNHMAAAAAAAELSRAILYNTKAVTTASLQLKGEYRLRGTASVPVVLGRDGIEKILVLPLKESEKKQFERCVQGGK